MPQRATPGKIEAWVQATFFSDMGWELRLMKSHYQAVTLLAGCQAALQTVMTTVIAVGGLAGLTLASAPSLATLPITCFVLGSAITSIPASLLMGAVGRRAGFQLGATAGVGGAMLCAYAMYITSFTILCAGMAVLGIHAAFGSYYRFAAADTAGPFSRAKAISFTLSGGIVGGFLGPELAGQTTGLFDAYPYLGTYLALSVVCLSAVVVLTRLDLAVPVAQEHRQTGRPLATIVKQPVFIVAALASALSYGVMNLMMTATPLAMRAHEHHFTDTALVFQWHMIAMFAPSFFTGALIQRFGVLNVIITGAMLVLVCIAAALSGTALGHFWVSLFLLGAGWNFMFVGGSTLLGECHTPAERPKTEAVTSFMVFLTMAIASASSGLLLSQSGWKALSYSSLPFVIAIIAATVWLMCLRRAAHEGGPVADINRA